MTTPTFRTASDDERHDPVRVTNPGALIAALPALLGYHPENSLILVSLGGPDGTELRTIMRHDLVPPDTPAPAAPGGPADSPMVATPVLDQYATRLVHEGSRAAVAVIVDAGAGRARMAHRALVTALGARLGAAGVALAGAFAVSAVTNGAGWSSVLDACWSGVVDDPDTSAVTVAQVYAGRRILGSRAEVAALVTADPERQREVRLLLDAAAESADLELSLGADDAPAEHRRTLEHVLRQIDYLAAGESLLPVELAELGAALRRTPVRDAALALAAGDGAADAERLWLLLTRSLPEPERAEAATLLAYSALLRGDGTLAGIALDAALDGAPWHRLAILLDQGLTMGLDRAALLRPALVGYDIALGLGVQLPRIRGDGDFTPA